MKIHPFRAAIGFLILFISILLLLTNSGLISWSIWLFAWQFWPMFFVIFGTAFLMRRWNLNFFLGILILAVIFSIVGTGIWLTWQDQYFDTDNFAEFNEENITETKISNEMPKKLENLDVKIIFGASKIEVGSLSDPNSNFLYEGTHDSNFFTLNQRLDTFGNSANLSFKASPFIKRPFNSKGINDLALHFSQKLKYSFDIESGASDIDLNLESLNVEGLDIDAGASKVTIRLSDKTDTHVKIKSGASTVRFHVPKGLGVRITSKSALISQNFEEFGLTKNGKTWESASCENAKSTVDIELESVISKVELAE